MFKYSRINSHTPDGWPTTIGQRVRWVCWTILEREINRLRWPKRASKAPRKDLQRHEANHMHRDWRSHVWLPEDPLLAEIHRKCTLARKAAWLHLLYGNGQLNRNYDSSRKWLRTAAWHLPFQNHKLSQPHFAYGIGPWEFEEIQRQVPCRKLRKYALTYKSSENKDTRF